MRYMRILLLPLLIVQLVFSSWQVAIDNVAAEGEVGTTPQSLGVKTRILEITESGNSDFPDKSFDSSYELVTMSMKKFVALREALDGKYDVIYIGKGNYSPEGVTYNKSDNSTTRTEKHNTKLKKNDITELKANEIVMSYIEKKLPVILHKDTISAQKDSILRTTFFKYKEAQRKSYVIFTDSPTAAIGDIKEVSEYYAKRPRIVITSAPTPYTEDSTKIYQPNESILFSYNVLHHRDVQANQLKVNLFIDRNDDGVYEESEIVQTAQMTGSVRQLSYTLPRGFSGIKSWKLEVLDTNSKLKDYHTGIFRFRDKKMEVNVLQVTKKKDDSSALTNPNILTQSYLSSEDYKINLEVMNLDTFNREGYQTINGTKNMLIFGFADSYSSDADLSDNAAKAIKDFINTGQSVMFTHDTISEYTDVNNKGNKWLTHFKDITGQTATHHGLGYGAPAKSTTTKKVNDGLINQFPFFLDEEITIAETHNQYFTLALEDHTLIPWYNITGSNRDEGDSWHHYYTYSKGNVTYSGTGHISSKLPGEEQKLFVNTMYRAFLGSNHAPNVTLTSPKEEDLNNNPDRITVTYKVEDIDLNDKMLYTRIYINDVEKYHTEVTNGATISQNFATPTTKGAITVRVEVTDPKGAKAIKEVYPKNLTFTRYFDDTDTQVEKIVKQDEETKITYKVTPRPLLTKDPEFSKQVTGIRPFAVIKQDFQLGKSYELTDSEGGKSGNIGALSLGGNGANDYRKHVLSGYGEPVKVGDRLSTKPGKMGVENEVAQLIAEGRANILVPLVDANEFYNGRSQVTVSGFAAFKLKSTGEKSKKFVVNATFMGYGQVPYETSTIKFREIFPAQVEVSNLPTGLTVEKETKPETGVIVSGTLREKVRYQLGGEQYTAYPVTFTLTVKPKEKGTFPLHMSTVTFTDVNGGEKQETFKPLTLQVQMPLQGLSVSPKTVTLSVGDMKAMLVAFTPAEANTQKVEWGSSHTGIATVDANGVVKAIAEGQATITVKSPDGKFADSAVVTVRPRDVLVESIDITSDTVYIYTGNTYQLYANIQPPYATNKEMTWSSSDSNVVTVNDDGLVKGVKDGTATIRALTKDGRKSDTVTVNVISDTMLRTFFDSGRSQSVPSDKEWFNKDVYVEITFPRDMTKEYLFDGKSSVYSGMVLVTKDGVTSFEYKKRPNDTMYMKKEIKIDKTMPTVTITDGTVDAATKTVRDIKITGTDATSGVEKIVIRYQLDDGSKIDAKTENMSSVIYNTPAVSGNKITVSAEAIDKAGNISTVATKDFFFGQVAPVPTVENFFITQPDGGKGNIGLQVKLSDGDVQKGVSKVSYTIDKINLQTKAVTQITSGSLTEDSSNKVYTATVQNINNHALGWYRVTATVTDNTNQTKEVSRDAFLISPGFDLARWGLPLDKSNKLITKSNKPITVSMQKLANSYFKVEDQAFGAELVLIRNLAEQEKKPLLDSLSDFNLLITKVEYAIMADDKKPEEANWKPLKSSNIVVSQGGTWKVYVRITDNYTRWSAKPVVNVIESPAFTIVPGNKKL